MYALDLRYAIDNHLSIVFIIRTTYLTFPTIMFIYRDYIRSGLYVYNDLHIHDLKYNNSTRTGSHDVCMKRQATGNCLRN